MTQTGGERDGSFERGIPPGEKFLEEVRIPENTKVFYKVRL